MTPFEIVCSEQQEIFNRRLAEERFRSLFAPISAYSELALRLTPEGNRGAIREIAAALRKALEPYDDGTRLLALLSLLVVEAGQYHNQYLGPLKAMASDRTEAA